jgi:hypothetical protein
MTMDAERSTKTPHTDDFLELRQGEVRRWPLLRPWVNRGAGGLEGSPRQRSHA